MLRLAVLAGAILLFCNATLADECQKPVPINAAPERSALNVDLRPRFEVHVTGERPAYGPCKRTETEIQYLISDKVKYPDPGVFRLYDQEAKGVTDASSLRSLLYKYNISKASHEGKVVVLNSDLLTGKNYWWRARLKYSPDEEDASNGMSEVWTEYSKPTPFTTIFVIDGICKVLPQPFINGPRTGQTVPLAPLLTIGIDDFGIESPCKFDFVEWQISLTTPISQSTGGMDFKTVLAGTYPGTSEVKLTVPLGKLKSDTIYYWQARVVGVGNKMQYGRISSPWQQSSFKTAKTSPQLPAFCSGLATPANRAPADNASVSLTPTLELGIAGISPACSWDETAWQILKADTGEYIYQTGFTEQKFTLSIPSAILEPNTKYIWRAKIVSRKRSQDGKDIFSDWSRQTEFSTGQ